MRSFEANAQLLRILLRWVTIALTLTGSSQLWAQGRVIVLGVDGMDHTLTKEALARGELPEFQKLAQTGAFRKLIPTNPAQSPVSWASLTTGRNPGQTGIFGFLRRDIRDGQVIPEMSMVLRDEKQLLTPGLKFGGYMAAFLIGVAVMWFLRRRRRLAFLVGLGVGLLLLISVRWFFSQIPDSLAMAVNLRSSPALWDQLDEEGIKVVSLGAPCGFPAPNLEHGHLLCGLGVPDLAGTPGTVTLWRAGPVPNGGRTTQMGGRELPLRRAPGSNELTGLVLTGPPNPLTKEILSVEVSASVEDGGVRLQWEGASALLELGKFSEHLPVKFPWNDVAKPIAGLVRFRLQEMEPHPVIYQEPVQFDPREPLEIVPIVAPNDYGKTLAKNGLFETAGWAVATNPYQDGLIDDATLIEDAESVQTRRVAMTLNAAKRDNWRVLFSVLSTPDRLQHVFWRDIDDQHPAHDPSRAAVGRRAIMESYRKVDALIGQLRSEILRPEDRLLVVSDHGFTSFRYAVNLNRWLQEEGYLSATPDKGRTLSGDLGKDAFRHVDWSRTRAYAMGLGRIWLNIEGREPHGTVSPNSAKALAAEIAEKLSNLRHEGQRVVRSVKTKEELYSGPRVNEASDLIVGFEPGFRISWNACLGGLNENVVFPNFSKWSGDHCSVDPESVPGILFSDQPLVKGQANVLDIWPTLRVLLQLPQDPKAEGRSLFP